MSFKFRVATARLPKTARTTSRVGRSIATRRSLNSGGAPSLKGLRRRRRLF